MVKFTPNLPRVAFRQLLIALRSSSGVFELEAVIVPKAPVSATQAANCHVPYKPNAPCKIGYLHFNKSVTLVFHSIFRFSSEEKCISLLFVNTI